MRVASAPVRGTGERRDQGLLVHDGQVEDAQPLADRLARELVGGAERGLRRVAQVLVEGGRVRRPEGR